MRLAAALVLLTLPCVACSGTETGNPPASRVSFALMTSDASVATVSGGSGHVIQTFRISFDSLTTLDCNGHDVGSSGAPSLVDLVSHSSSISVPSGDYCGLRVHLAPNSGTPALHVDGARSDGIPFTIDDPNPISVALTSPTPFTIHGDEPLVVNFDVALWFAGTFLLDAAPSGGHVTIDGSSNATALTQFESQINAALYRDLNDDGHIDHSDGPSVAAGHGPHTP